MYNIKSCFKIVHLRMFILNCQISMVDQDQRDSDWNNPNIDEIVLYFKNNNNNKNNNHSGITGDIWKIQYVCRNQVHVLAKMTQSRSDILGQGRHSANTLHQPYWCAPNTQSQSGMEQLSKRFNLLLFTSNLIKCTPSVNCASPSPQANVNMFIIRC